MHTANLPAMLKIGVGARVLLTDNFDVADRLMNGAMGTVLYLDVKRDDPLIGRIFVKFDDPKAGNTRKDGRLWGELKHCVAITAKTKSFPYHYRNKTVIVERKQYPLVLACAITIH